MPHEAITVLSWSNPSQARPDVHQRRVGLASCLLKSLVCPACSPAPMEQLQGRLDKAALNVAHEGGGVAQLQLAEAATHCCGGER